MRAKKNYNPLENEVNSMARDTELDRLKAAQDLAFQRKQRAYETMQAAWKRRSSARDEMARELTS